MSDGNVDHCPKVSLSIMRNLKINSLSNEACPKIKETKDDNNSVITSDKSAELAYPTVWKKAFALTDNVRFTRTPEVELLRRRIENDPAFAQKYKAFEEAKKDAAQKASSSHIEVIEPQQVKATNGDECLNAISMTSSHHYDEDKREKSSKQNENTRQNVIKNDESFSNNLALETQQHTFEETLQTTVMIKETTRFKDKNDLKFDENEDHSMTGAFYISEKGEKDKKSTSTLMISAYLSDSAFFELGFSYIDDSVEKAFDHSVERKDHSKTSLKKTAQIATSEGMSCQRMHSKTVTQDNIQQDPSITDLYRVLECRFPLKTHLDSIITDEKNDHHKMESSDDKNEVSITEQTVHNVIDNLDVVAPSKSQVALDENPIVLSEERSTAHRMPEQSVGEISVQENSKSDLSDKIQETDGSQEKNKLTDQAFEEKCDIDCKPGNDCEEDHSVKKFSLSSKVEDQNLEEQSIENAIDDTPVVENKHADVQNHTACAVTKSAAGAPFRSLNPAFMASPTAKTYGPYQFPSIELLQKPVYNDGAIISQETLERSAGLLESVLEDFGVKGEIIHVRPGPVVTMYEFEPAAGVKSSRVIGLSDDIARSMSAISARVAVIPGRNVIGIELPNSVRDTVYLRELIQSKAFQESNYKLALALGKSIGGEPVIAELAKMPHLLVAGTTGSGKSVAINTMILSLLYRMSPDQCRLIMVDPKMLELSIYDGIPHLLTPVVTDPKKAVTALKWAVREMEDRYRKMAKLGVRNIDGFNSRVAAAAEKGETIMCTVQSGFDKETGEMLYHEEAMDLAKLPYIVVIVDEMADLMMVAGKEIEGAIQRLAQMARAAGIHLIMATQRPSVDVITGTIKANFPTRISFQVTSKIDSRTILGEQGAETLLGQGDMLHMVGGGRIVRVHGPFVSDEEVEQVVAHLKTQGTPDYLATVTDGDDGEDTIDEAGSIADIVAANNSGEDGEELYLQAVKIVMRDKKCSTSYIQRRLSIGYNKAASLVERMEEEGIVGAANHVGKREILINGRHELEG
ncbi:DNA translocase FtsK [Bartonella tamiae]|uniref:DNA translocase ftsK n=1 Tax=Bartonella tamiae Th239 TaxID=1094558 RepID=J1JWQ1_9HYPH|nr:DNA translocase FtsK [Bartonella tamiae]EJF89407.1 DNA translocase ftsK [Bartonella tamiae Th239]